MKGYFNKRLMVMVLVALMAFVTACNNSTTQPSAAPATRAPANTTQATTQPDPWGKYDPPVEVTAVRYTDSSFRFKDGESMDNNAWTRLYEEELGIKIRHEWIVNGDQYNQRMNLTITSNDLPDIFMVDARQLKELAEAGRLEDLTQLVEDYGSPLTKEMIDRGTNAKAAATYDGKLMAIPPAEDYLGASTLLWVRTDWLDNLSLPEPVTMDDFIEIATAFTTGDPDGNNIDDTYGLAVSKDIMGGYPNVTGFMNGYHAYMNIWVEGDDGQLVYSSIQPEMKTALGKLQELYSAGVIDMEFGVKDGGKVAEMQTASQIGMNFGAMWNPLWPLQENVNSDPDAEWQAYPIPSSEGRPGLSQSSADFNSFWVVRKGAANPEALIKLFNMYNEKIVSVDAEPSIYHTDDGHEVFKYAVASNGFGTPAGLLAAHKNVVSALQSNDPASLVPEERSYYDNIVAFQQGDRAHWGTNKVFGEGGAWATIGEYYVDNDQLMKNEFFGNPTPGMTERNAILDQLVLETFTKIILGAPLSDFDKFVDDWNQLGGRQITEEVNEWYSSRS